VGIVTWLNPARLHLRHSLLPPYAPPKSSAWPASRLFRLVADQYASRLARGDRLRWLYGRRHPSGQPDRPAARPATLSRLERSERAVLLRNGAVRQPAPGARIPRLGGHCHGRHVYARAAGAYPSRRRGNTRPHSSLVHQLVHHRRVAVVPVRPRRNAAGLAQRFCYRRHARRCRCLDCLGGAAAWGFWRRERAPAAARLSPGACEPGCPRSDGWLCRGHMGLRRIAAVDCRLPDLLCRR